MCCSIETHLKIVKLTLFDEFKRSPQYHYDTVAQNYKFSTDKIIVDVYGTIS